MKTELVIIDEKSIRDKIYNIRGKQVMIDSDLAKIYGYTTKAFNQQVQRNIEKFDDDFMFQLTSDEVNTLLRSQIVTSSLKSNYGGRRYLPYVFTEEGIYMLMTVLKGELAIKQSKVLIKIFKKMKDYLISSNIIEQKYINKMVLEDHDRIDLLENTFKEIKKEELNNQIFFKGQIYDAYSLLLDILESALHDIIIIDNYVDKNILDLVSKINIKVTIISKNMNEELINKYKKQYNNLIIKQNNEFHDRFIILDKKELYHLGSSLKDLGKSCFAINKINNEKILNELLKLLE